MLNREKVRNIIDTVTKDIEAIADPNIKSIQKTLLNLVELLMAENEQLRDENQKLKDEINRLKGEQGKPNIRSQTKNKGDDHSSENERNKKKKKNTTRSSKKKKHKIKIDRTQICEVDQNQLPEDAVFKGYQTVIVQDIIIITDNIEFKKKTYYSPSMKKTFTADLPDGYQGEFGPKLKALVLDLHYTHKMTESAILRHLTTHGIIISAATIARMIARKYDDFHQEKQDIVQEGLASSTHQQLDDTGARVKGKNHYTHVLCNHLYTAYFTRPHKDRLTIIDILTQGEMKFQFNESAYALMEQMKLPKKQLKRLRGHLRQTLFNRDEVEQLLGQLFPVPNTHQTNRRIILEASAIIAYKQSTHAIAILLTDDAPQFKLITDLLALCWVHDGRHYKKLRPVASVYQRKLDQFLDQYWEYYHCLLEYSNEPTAKKAHELEQDFDKLFITKTGYEQLDERIEKTKLKKDSLLLVLEHPSLPLHNNTSELGARAQARYRDTSFHTMSEEGTETKDTFMTITETAKKLVVNTYEYFYDRLTKKRTMPSLSELIKEKSQTGRTICDSG